MTRIGRYWEQGYTLVPGAIQPDRIATWREAALGRAQTGELGDLLSDETLAEFVLDDHLLESVTHILGEEPVYFGDSNVSILDRVQRGWHKDNADRFDASAPDWHSRYTIVRVACYLQDHARHSGGVNVRQRSHQRDSRDRGPTRYVASRPGDLVIWNLRTTHSADGVLVRGAPWLGVPPRVASFLPRVLVAPREPRRVALFATFGVPDTHLDRYLQYLMTREYAVETWRHSCWSQSVRRTAAARRVLLREMKLEVTGRSNLGENVKYEPIPYESGVPQNTDAT